MSESATLTGRQETGALAAVFLRGGTTARGSRATVSRCLVAGEAPMAESHAANPCLRGLTAEEAENILESSVRKSLLAGETILLEGDSVVALHTVISGAVKLYRVSPEGKEQILRIVRPLGAFHSTAVFDGRASPFSAQALTPTLVDVILSNDLPRLMRDCPQFAANMVALLLQDVRHYVSLVGDLSFKKASGRLAKVLLESLRSAVDTASVQLSHQDMAAMTGTVRETVSRTLKAMEGKGIIKMNGRRISIVDAVALRELAAADDAYAL